MKMRNVWLVSLMILLSPAYPWGPSGASAQVTPPEDFLGFEPGADFHLMTYEEGISYFEHIAAQTDRMIVLDMGETTGGRRMKYGVISSAENLQRLDHFKDLNRRISLPKGLGEEGGRQIAGEGKAFVWIEWGSSRNGGGSRTVPSPIGL